jgi:hypothetical protein
MSRRIALPAVLAAASLMAMVVAGSASAQEAITLDVTTLDANGCFGQAACSVGDAALSTGSGTLAQQDRNGASGFGVSGNPAGDEIGIGETLRVEVENARQVAAIQFLFLYNGSEFGSSAEKATVNADGTVYTLAVRNDADDATADWSGPGTVTKCGATTSQGTGCFLVADPFPDAVSRLDFGAATGGAPFAGGGSGDSDYAIGSIEIEAQTVVELGDCAGTTGCTVATGTNNGVGFSLNSVHATNPGGSTEALVIPVKLPDCRYIPMVCLELLSLPGESDDNAARAALISAGVIKSAASSAPAKLHPATQSLNVTPLLSTEITTLFDASGVPPNGLPPLYIAPRWKAQSVNDGWFDGYFFKTDSTIKFTDVFQGLIDVSVLTGDELGCEADPDDLLAWDVITTVSELAKSVGGQYIDTLINIGCINPTKVSGTRLSLYSINFEPNKDTYGPTITSTQPKVTENNDAVFARLVQSLWKDLGDIRANYACKVADPGGQAPLSSAQCKKLASIWSQADNKIKLCINATFESPVTGNAFGLCDFARDQVDAFEAALPATATGPDVYNRLGELGSRVEAFQHVWDTRFIPSIKPLGFCSEFGTCSP